MLNFSIPSIFQYNIILTKFQFLLGTATYFFISFLLGTATYFYSGLTKPFLAHPIAKLPF